MIGKGPAVKTVTTKVLTTITPARPNHGSAGAELLGSSNTHNNGEAKGCDDRVCPTRVSAAPTLIAHKITIPECQKRQRESYHKCWTCAHRNLSPFHAAAPAKNGAHTNGIVKSNGIVKNGEHSHSNGSNTNGNNGSARNGSSKNGAPKFGSVRP
ncbi:MAG: hypothetical protein ACKVS6_08075 [Planctomycetota bacterium]